MEKTDSDLVARTRAGDKEAFGRLIERHRARAMRVGLTMLRDEHAAEELVQEAMLQAYLSLDRLRDPARFAAWLHGIVLNVCRRSLQDREPDWISWESMDWEPGATPRAAFDPERAVEQREEERLVLDAVHALSPENRDATLLFYYEQRSLQEIADALGISVGAAKGRLYQSRKQLRESLRPLLPEGRTRVMKTPPRKKMVRVSVLSVYHGWDQMDRDGPGASPAHARRFLLQLIASQSGEHRLGLMEEKRHRFLPIRVGRERDVIRARLTKESAEAPSALALAIELLHAGGLRLEEVRIEPLHDGVCHATLKVRYGETVRDVEAHPGAGIALAVYAGSPIYAAQELMRQSAWDLSDALEVVERLRHSEDAESLRRAAEEPFLVRVAEGILEGLRQHVPAPEGRDGAQLMIETKRPKYTDNHVPPWVYMTYCYAGNVGGGNVAMPQSMLPVVIARFKLMASLDLAEQHAPQRGHVSIERKGKTYDLLVSTEPNEFGEKLTLGLER